MPDASLFWDPSSQTFAAGGPLRASLVPSTGPSRSGTETLDVGGKYPPLDWQEPLTAAQVLDISLACEAAMRTPGKPQPLREPFTYNGIGTPGLQVGDRVTHMLYVNGACITNAEAKRRGLAGAPLDRKKLAYAALAAIVFGAGAYSLAPKRSRLPYAVGAAALGGAGAYWYQTREG